MRKFFRSIYVFFFKVVGKIIYRKRKTIRIEEEDSNNETSIYVSNHSGALGPAIVALYFDRPNRMWGTAQMLQKKVAANYVYHDFFCGRGKKHKRLFRLISAIVAKIIRPVLRYYKMIGVYHDVRIMRTLKESVDTLSNNENIVIFAESPYPLNQYIHKLHSGFVDVARLYYKKTNKKLKFYPVFIPAKERTINIGTPITFNPDAEINTEKERIVNYLETQITNIADSIKPEELIPFLTQDFYNYYSDLAGDYHAYCKFVDAKRSE